MNTLHGSSTATKLSKSLTWTHSPWKIMEEQGSGVGRVIKQKSTVRKRRDDWMVRSVHLWPTCWSWFYGLGGGSFHMAGSIQSCWFEVVYAGDPLLSGHVIETRTRARIKFANKDYPMYEKGSSGILLIWSLPWNCQYHAPHFIQVLPNFTSTGFTYAQLHWFTCK